MDKEILRDEAAHNRMLASQLLESFGDLDDDTLKDTLHGLSTFPDMIEEIVRSSLDDEVIVVGLKSRMSDMAARLERFQDRNQRKRNLACWAMGMGGLDRLNCPEFSVSYRMGGPRLEVIDDTKIPADYLAPLPPKLKRAELTTALKAGQQIEGVRLIPAAPHIQVCTR